jgi:hypothetical protein
MSTFRPTSTDCTRPNADIARFDEARRTGDHQQMQKRHFRTPVWCAWAGCAFGAALALLAPAFGWPVWIGDLAVALGYACAFPMLLNIISGGLAGRVFPPEPPLGMAGTGA